MDRLGHVRAVTEHEDRKHEGAKTLRAVDMDMTLVTGRDDLVEHGGYTAAPTTGVCIGAADDHSLRHVETRRRVEEGLRPEAEA